MTKRSWFRVHSFTGVITGLMLFVICWSGTFAIISQEIDWLVTPETRVEGGTEPASWGTITNAARAAHPDGEIGWITAPLYARSAAKVYVDTPVQSSLTVHVDPYTAEVQGTWSYFDVQRFFRSFHMNLFGLEVLGIRIGNYLVVAFALTMLTSLVAGLVFYKRWWRRFFDRPKPGRALWSDLHKLAGLWSIWFVLIIGLTSVWYLFEMARMDVGDGKIAWAGTGEHAVHQISQPTSEPSLSPLALDRLVAEMRKHRPDLGVTSIAIGSGTVTFEGQAGHLLVRDRANKIVLDRRTGAVLHDQTPQDYSLYWRWSDTADPLHFGNFAGLSVKLVWFAFGFLLSGLIFTGTLLHARRLVAGAGGGRHRWPGTLAALSVTLAVLAATVPAGLAEAQVFYGPLVEGERHLPTLAPGVLAVIVAWTAVTVGLIAAWAALLWRPTEISATLMKSSAKTRASRR